MAGEADRSKTFIKTKKECLAFSFGINKICFYCCLGGCNKEAPRSGPEERLAVSTPRRQKVRELPLYNGLLRINDTSIFLSGSGFEQLYFTETGMTLIQYLARFWRGTHRFLGASRVLMGSFAVLISIGTFLLMLPISTTTSRLSFVDALFTATSATCVTGLIVVDTGTAFTHFGQMVILVLIQFGGLGLMTFSTFVVYLLGKKLSIGGRELLQQTFSQLPILTLKKLVKTIFLTTAVVETIGAIVLTIRFARTMPLAKAAYFAAFHAISAFCNAGFSLFSDSMIGYRSDFTVNFVLLFLIVTGGLGFVVISEIGFRRSLKFRKLSLHSRLVILTSGILIVSGFVLFFLMEYKNTLTSLDWKTKFFTALFQSITTRTAGFNSVDIGTLSNATLFIMIILMFIGASPGSCGGGIKTTTFAILISQIRASFKSKDETNLLYRRIPKDVLSKAISVGFFSTVLVVVFTILLLSTELPGLSHQVSRGLFLEILFEATSAFGTVGLSTGLTPHLSPLGRVLIVFLMFIGRLGPITIALAVGNQKKDNFRYAAENIMVG